MNAVVTAVRTTLATTFGRDIEVVLNPTSQRGFDGTLVLTLDVPPVPLMVVARQYMSTTDVAASRHEHSNDHMILFVPRLTPSIVDTCRALGVNCADADGNLFVRTSTNAVDIVGRPVGASRDLAGDTSSPARLTSRSGLQIIFVLLVEPEFCNAPYRTIANASAASLGTVASVFRALDRDGYVARTAHGRELRRTSQLLNTWTDGYRVRLFDKLRLGGFSADQPDWWQVSRDVVRQAGGQWGGETAVWAAGGNLRPAHGIVYVDDVAPALVGALRLRRDSRKEAPAELRRRFWRVASWSERDTVPSPLVYADLLADGDPRLIEAAASLRNDDAELRRLDES